jgi:hypothetical protein
VTALRCTAKLLKRLKQPAKLPEPPPTTNPLGEWYADIDFIDHEPFVLLLNAATGAALVLPGRAADLRDLHMHAGQQLFKQFVHFGFDPNAPLVAAELRAWDEPPIYAKTRDRSLLGSMNRYRDEAWQHFAHASRSLPEVAAQLWQGLFRHPSLAPPGRRYGYDAWHRPLDLVQMRLATKRGIIGAGEIMTANNTLHRSL